MDQIERAHVLKALHVKGNPLILYNVWDAGSARAVEEVGAKAIATGSWSVAAAHGYKDGEKLSLDVVALNTREIVANVTIPVSIDFEGGYGKTPTELAASVVRVIEAGAVGINFEDQIIGGDGLYSIEEQSTRIKAVRHAAEQTGIPLFINARTDIFLKAAPPDHNQGHLDEAIQRASAFAEAGGSGFFAPGLRKAEYIEKLCAASPLPVNIMKLADGLSAKELADLGVARISYGPYPYRQMIEFVKEAAQKVLSME